MINYFMRATVKRSCFLILITLSLSAQSDSDLERRVAELERKIRLLDPSFGLEGDRDLAQRISVLESKISKLLAERTTVATQSPPQEPPASESPDLQSFAATSVRRPEPEQEQRLPVSGYMDFHFNKQRSEPGQLDFHRFVLLFGHSFSERIKFWSELEVEHALVEGGEEKGEMELE